MDTSNEDGAGFKFRSGERLCHCSSYDQTYSFNNYVSFFTQFIEKTVSIESHVSAGLVVGWLKFIIFNPIIK